jgi:hypothetical protein
MTKGKLAWVVVTLVACGVITHALPDTSIWASVQQCVATFGGDSLWTPGCHLAELSSTTSGDHEPLFLQ